MGFSFILPAVSYPGQSKNVVNNTGWKVESRQNELDVPLTQKYIFLLLFLWKKKKVPKPLKACSENNSSIY